MTHDGNTAVAADPDRDVVYVVDVGARRVSFTVSLQSGDEPGRLVEDGAGRVHVALRGSGALVTIDPSSGAVVDRRPVCTAPRGVAWDATSDRIWTACATGELVEMPAAGGAATRTLVLERDLRDIMVDGASLAVTKFRSAEVLRVATDGSVSRRDGMPSPLSTFVSHVAWRTVAGPSGSLFAVHQAESTTSLATKVPGGYGGGGCGGGFLPQPPPTPPAPVPPVIPVTDAGPPGLILPDSGSFGGGCLGPESGAVLAVLTALGKDGTSTLVRPITAALPVDMSVSPDGLGVAVVAPGNAFTGTLTSILYFDQGGAGNGWQASIGNDRQPIAVAFDPGGHLLVQSREPAELWVVDVASRGANPMSIVLSNVTRGDTGHDIFHTQAGALIACASCHPEGGDDGHVWILDGERRRTPSLRGTIAGTAPYHWPGDEPDLNVLVDDVYTRRMSGVSLAPGQMGALTAWVQSVPAPPAPAWVDASAATRGGAIFQRADVGCSTCHFGPKFTNNVTTDVGTGGKFQVPPLVGVGWRTPLMHDGCAATIADRFGACATAVHGSIGSLSAQDISDLTAYLETL